MKLPDIKVVLFLNLYFILIYQTEFVVMAILACPFLIIPQFGPRMCLRYRSRTPRQG